MPFSINIYDKSNLYASTVFEHAEAKSLVLTWLGGAEKLQTIIGSELAFSMEVTNYKDAYFNHLATQDERQYRVTVVNEDVSSVVWQGHLLPDQYEEPYANGAFFVNFIASCGLGSLKNQYLSPEFYTVEKTLVEVISELLKLTGLSLDILIAPAIRNKVYKKWDEYIVDTSQYVYESSYLDAYTVLNKILNASLCRIHQADNSWFIVGLNQLPLFEIIYNKYLFNGDYVGEVVVNRSPKQPVFYNIPLITANTPRQRVEVDYKLNVEQIKKSVYKQENDGYVVFTDLELINHEWVYSSSNFQAKYNTKNGLTFLAPLVSSSVEFIRLRDEILVSIGSKLNWQIELYSEYNGSTQGRTDEEIVLDGDWQKLQPYDIYYTDPTTGVEVILYSNFNGSAPNDLRYQLSFNKTRKAELSIKMIAPATGYYNIKFYQPIGVSGVKVEKIYIESLQLQILDQQEKEVFTDEINQTFTQDEKIEIELHDDIRKIENFIRFKNLNDSGDLFDIETFSNFEVLNTNGKNYIKLSLPALKLAAANKLHITVNNTPLLVVDYIYNYLGSQEMLLQYDADSLGFIVKNGDSIQITQRAFAGIPTDVEDWQKYADTFNSASYARYGEVYVKILRNLYAKSHPLLTGSCRGFVGLNDLVAFNYNGDKIWYPLDVVYKLDAYETELILSQNFYGGAVTKNLPPIVNAGEDQVIQSNENSVILVATANDVDGEIVDVVWEVISGFGSPIIETFNQLTTNVTGLAGDLYQFQVTVTDNTGLTASDTLYVSRAVDYTLVLTPVSIYTNTAENDSQYQFQRIDRKWFDVTVSPPLLDDQVVRLTIDGVIIKETPAYIAGALPSVVFTMGYDFQYFDAGVYQMIVLLRAGNVKRLALQAKVYNSARFGVFPEYAEKVHSKIQADITAEIISGKAGVFINTPIQIIVEARR